MRAAVDWLLSAAVDCRIFLVKGREFGNQTALRLLGCLFVGVQAQFCPLGCAGATWCVCQFSVVSV